MYSHISCFAHRLRNRTFMRISFEAFSKKINMSQSIEIDDVIDALTYIYRILEEIRRGYEYYHQVEQDFKADLLKRDWDFCSHCFASNGCKPTE